MASRRQYINQAYITQYASGYTLNSDFTNEDDLISLAEEMIDNYVGFQTKWFRISSNANAGVYTAPDFSQEMPINRELRGRVSQVLDNQNFKLMGYQQNTYQGNFFQYCWIEIIGGAGIGQTNQITASLINGQITVATAWTTPLDVTSIYRIYQLGKFPRIQDVFYDALTVPLLYYKTIPEAVQRATAAQAMYINRMGRAFFESDAMYMTSERIDKYAYSRSPKGVGQRVMIAPEARTALRGIVNRKGTISVT